MNFTLTNKFPAGSCLQGRIEETYARLVEVFGEPNCDGDEYKVQKEWVIEFDDGTIATIYDYKEGDAYNGEGQGTHYTRVTDWHIGGRNQRAVLLVNEALAGVHTAGVPDDEPMYTEDQIARLAQRACFYVTTEGEWLRMQYTDLDEGYFMAMDEVTNVEYRFDFVDLVYGEPEFHELTKMTI